MTRAEGDRGVAGETKVCPFCAETIKAAAIKCRYCQSDLDPDAASQPSVDSTTTIEASPASRSGSVSFVKRRRDRDRTTPSAPKPLPVTAEAAQPKDESPGPRPAPRLLVALIGLVCLVMVGVAAYSWQQRRTLDADAEAGQVARATVADKVETLLSYRHSSFDDDVAAAQKLLTEDFREEYAPTVAEIRKRAISQRRDQQAEVLAVGLVSADDDAVRTLVFVNTLSGRQEGVEPPTVMQNRVTVDLVRVGSEWFIDDFSFPST